MGSVAKRAADKLSEREKFKRIRQGHREFLGDFITGYYDEVLRFCIYYIRDVDSAYDITQETFLRFIKNVDSLEYKNLKGYLLAVARNLCADCWKAHQREQAADPVQEFSAREEVREAAGYERAESRMLLADVLSKLPESQREAVILRYYNDLKLEEISRILGVNLSTVKSRLRLGMQRMRQYLT